MATGSLLGKADTTLVQMAYTASAANAPVDLSGVHERLARAHSKTMKSIGDAWVKGISATAIIGTQLIAQAKERGERYDAMDAYNKAEYETDLRITAEEYENLSDSERIELDEEFAGREEESVHTDINGYSEPIKFKTIREQLKSIRQEMLSLGIFGDSDLSREEKKRRREQLQLKKDNLKKASFEFQSYKNVMKEQLNLNNVDIASSDPVKMQFARALLAEGKPLGENAGELAGSRAVMGFDEIGNMTFMFVDQYGRPVEDSEGNQLSIQQSNVDSLLVPRNPAIQTGIDLITDKTKNRATGAKYGEAYDVNPINSFVENTILDINGFKNASNYKGVHMDASLASSLHGVSYDANGEPIIASTLLSSGIFGELNNLPMSLDISEDGKVNELDFKSEENYKELVDYILSGKDLALSKKVLQTHLTNIASGHHQLGVDAFTVEERAKRYTGVVTSSEDKDKKDWGLPSDYIRIGKTIDGRYQHKMKPWRAENLLNDVATGTNFEFEEMNYSYVFSKDGSSAWHRWSIDDAEQIATESTRVGSAADLETYVFKTSHPAFLNNVTEKTEGEFVDEKGATDEVSKEEYAPGTASTIPGLESTINFASLSKGDDTVVKNLNLVMPTQFTNKNPKGYYWDQGRTGSGGGLIPLDDPWIQAIQLFDGNGNAVKWPVEKGGRKYVYIRIKGEHRKNAIIWVDKALKAFGLAENMKTNTGGGGAADNIGVTE